MRDHLKEANQFADALNIQVPTTDKSPYPASKSDNETFGAYRQRIMKLVQNGFDLSRLSFADYTDYCRGNYAPSSTEFDAVVEAYEKQDSTTTE